MFQVTIAVNEEVSNKHNNGITNYTNYLYERQALLSVPFKPFIRILKWYVSVWERHLSPYFPRLQTSETCQALILGCFCWLAKFRKYNGSITQFWADFFVCCVIQRESICAAEKIKQIK